LQFVNGGYNGSDITIIAKEFGITPKALRYHIYSTTAKTDLFYSPFQRFVKLNL